MGWTRVLAKILILAVSCLAVLASSAGAKSGSLHMLGLKKCNSVLTGGDFGYGLEELSSTRTISVSGTSLESSVCEYGDTSSSGPGERQIFPEPPSGNAPSTGLLEGKPDSVATACFKNLVVTEGKSPGGCYSIATTVLVISEGAKTEALLRHYLKKHLTYHDKNWPTGFTRAVLHSFGAGTVAEVGYRKGASGETDAYGFLDVANAQITIEEKAWAPANPHSMLALLHAAKSKI